MRGAFRHTFSQRKRWKLEIMDHPPYSLDLAPSCFYLFLHQKTSRWGKVRRRWWGARRNHDVVQRAGGRLLWLGDTEGRGGGEISFRETFKFCSSIGALTISLLYTKSFAVRGRNEQKCCTNTVWHSRQERKKQIRDSQTQGRNLKLGRKTEMNFGREQKAEHCRRS